MSVSAKPGYRVYPLTFSPVSGTSPLRLGMPPVRQQAVHDLAAALKAVAGTGASVAVSVSGDPLALHAETDSAALATAVVGSGHTVAIAGVPHVAEHGHVSPLFKPGQFCLRAFAPHEDASAVFEVLSLAKASLVEYFQDIKSVEPLRSDETGAVKMLWVVLQPGAVIPEGGLRVPVRVEVPAVAPGGPSSYQSHTIDISPFMSSLQPPARKRQRDDAAPPHDSGVHSTEASRLSADLHDKMQL